MTGHNMAEAQARWDRGDVPEWGCYRKGREHAAYGWAASGLGFRGDDAQRKAYRRGYDDEVGGLPTPPEYAIPDGSIYRSSA